MSDFLANLVSRHLGAAPVIRPRLPSLFEPSTPLMTSFADNAFSAYESKRAAPMEAASEKKLGEPLKREDTAPQVRKEETKTSSTLHSSVPALPPAPLRATIHAHQPVSRSQATQPGTAQPEASVPQSVPDSEPPQPYPALRPATARNASTDDKKLLRPSTTRSEPPISSLPDSRAITYVEERPAARNTKPPAWKVSPPAFEESAATSDRKPAERPATTKIETPARAPIESARPTTPPRQPLPRTLETELLPATQPAAPAQMRPVAPTRFDFARQVPPARQVSAPEPTIQVTIGRIEVRAVSSQSAPKKERSDSPVMTLNEYLRSKRSHA